MSDVLVIAPNWLGDAVMALPAVADVRRHLAGARLMVAARPSVAGLFAMVPGVDEVIELQWRGRLLDTAALTRDASRLGGAGAELAILLPNSFASAWLAWRAGVPERWGYAGDLRTPLLTRAIPKPAGSLHQSAYYQHLVRALGIPNGSQEACVVVPDTGREEARRLLAAAGRVDGRPLVAVAPGAAYGTAKRWLPRHFATLVSGLVEDRGAQCVMVGSAGDRETVREIEGLLPASIRAHVIDLCGQTTLAGLCGVLAASDACASNDSGAMHVAAAVGVPLAAIFGPTREAETAPLARAGVDTRVLLHHVACRPCMLRECPIDHPCMRDLDPAVVRDAVDAMLAAPSAGRPR
jgi:heptosyltransferase-2